MLLWHFYFTWIEQCYPKVNTVPNSYALFNALLFLKKFGAELTCALEGDVVLPFLD